MTTTKTKIFATLVSIFLGSIFGGMIYLCSYLYAFVEKTTAPLPLPTPRPISNALKTELCEKLGDMQTDSVCLDGKAVLASDTFALFEKKFILNETTQDDVINVLGTGRLEAVAPFGYPDYHEFDLTGTGANKIIIWSNEKHIVKAVVISHPEVFIPLSQDTIIDLCNKLSLENLSPCTKTGEVYAQDFLPTIKEIFFDKPDTEKLFSPLAPYTYIESPRHYKLFFEFYDNQVSSVLFYFDENTILENIAFIVGFGPAPLDAEVLADLCHNIPIGIEKCKPDAQIYTTDLTREIRAAFPIGSATYEDVQRAIGKYQYEFTHPDRDWNRAGWYDFVGNNYTRISIGFDKDFIVRYIYFFSGGGS